MSWGTEMTLTAGRFFASGWAAAAIVASALQLLSGCAFTTGPVDLAYQPSEAPTKVASDVAPVSVEVTDKRATQVVGQKINGWGMKTADIVSDSDVPTTLK